MNMKSGSLSPVEQAESTDMDAVQPFSTFTSAITFYYKADRVDIDVKWVTTLPPVETVNWAVVLSADTSSAKPSGLYVVYNEMLRLAVPYNAMCDYTARGLEFDVYLDVTSEKTPPVGAITYHDGAFDPRTKIPAGAGVYAAVTLDDVARKRETVLATATTVGGVKGSRSIAIDTQGQASVDASMSVTWTGTHVYQSHVPLILVNQTAPDYVVSASELITRKFADANYKSGGASGANPTAKAGLTAVNGSATTFMRSDAAPALDQSITPTWKGAHLFNKSGKQMVQFADAFSDANTTRTDLASLDTPYVGVGGREWGKAYYVVGYGYSKNAATYPVLVGSHEVTTSGNTTGEFIVATRGGADPSTPTVKFKVTPDGRPEITNDQTKIAPDAQELITRKYADASYKSGGLAVGSVTGKASTVASKPTEIAVDMTDKSLMFVGITITGDDIASNSQFVKLKVNDVSRLQLGGRVLLYLSGASNVTIHLSTDSTTPFQGREAEILFGQTLEVVWGPNKAWLPLIR
ncbi:hypothetical protein [Pandoraea sputorum]|uniref:Uncharacterized protein n=1 Tax=Pandoraea sputorum TaxID=93222 RepID=A0A5E5APP2_9BURK|nr:hypothetical protein [Pandoraea sputorum]VVE75761.1 hypothetical protein PSP31121_00593 [Pandoraea sputorum]